MDEKHRTEGIESEDEVEAHGVREVATVGLSAAALLAASGTAAAATGASQPASSHGAAHVAKKADPTYKIDQKTDPTMKIVDKVRKSPPPGRRVSGTNKAGDITLKRGINNN